MGAALGVEEAGTILAGGKAVADMEARKYKMYGAVAAGVVTMGGVLMYALSD